MKKKIFFSSSVLIFLVQAFNMNEIVRFFLFDLLHVALFRFNVAWKWFHFISAERTHTHTHTRVSHSIEFYDAIFMRLVIDLQMIHFEPYTKKNIPLVCINNLEIVDFLFEKFNARFSFWIVDEWWDTWVRFSKLWE